MQNIDFNILKRNVIKLMEDNRTTQKMLAEELGVKQPTVSKCLSLDDDSHRFTLEQVCIISQYFDVSLDSLIGTPKPKSSGITPRAIASFISKVIESHDAKVKPIEVEEDIFEDRQTYNVFSGPSTSRSGPFRKPVSYLAIYFPDYWEVPEPDGYREDVMDRYNEAIQIGNESRMIPVNDFLRKFIQIHEVYANNGVDEDAYRTVVDNYLSKLRDY